MGPLVKDLLDALVVCDWVVDICWPSHVFALLDLSVYCQSGLMNGVETEVDAVLLEKKLGLVIWGFGVFFLSRLWLMDNILKWVTFNMSIMNGQRGTRLLLRARFSNRRGVK